MSSPRLQRCPNIMKMDPKAPSSEMTDVTLFTDEVNTLIDADAKLTKMVPHRRSMQPPVLA